MLGPTMLRVVSQQFWVRLYDPISSIMLGVVGTCCVVHARRVGRGGAMGSNAPPLPHGPKRSAWKVPKMDLRKKENPKDESFLLICQRT